MIGREDMAKWDRKTPLAPKNCARCEQSLPLLRHYKTYLCATCKQDFYPDRSKFGHDAHRMVAAAVRFGYLTPISECTCVDCGAPAVDYDHRDYGKPLDVDPVCRACNIRRGPAKPFLGLDSSKAPQDGEKQ